MSSPFSRIFSVRGVREGGREGVREKREGGGCEGGEREGGGRERGRRERE